ncbi:hypothetical protein IAU60_001965 [Kwoniella sp. DSM 27419]
MSAAAQLGQTSDILSQVLGHLPPPSLFSTLLVSKRFFHLTAPHLYHTLTIKHGLRDVSVGSTRPDILALEVDAAVGRAETDFSKNGLLRLVRRVDVHMHGKNECPFVLNYLQAFPNLQVVHLAGGERPRGLDDVCEPDQCQFVTKVCVNARRAIVRDLHDVPAVSPFKRLERVTLKLRPCQLPGTGRMGDVTDGGFGSFSLPGTVRELDVVWWDEQHDHRLDGYVIHEGDVQYAGACSWGRGGPRWPVRIKGCTYCDQFGCVRMAPDPSSQLPSFMKVSREKTRLQKVRHWNMDLTTDRPWYGSTRVKSLDEIKNEMVHGFLGIDTASESEPPDRVTFHKAEEYFQHGMGEDEIDPAEAEYWNARLFPSLVVKALRDEVALFWPQDRPRVYEVWSAEQLRSCIEREALDEAVRAEGTRDRRYT